MTQQLLGCFIPLAMSKQCLITLRLHVLSFQHCVKANKRRKEKDSVNNVGGNRQVL